MKRPQKESVQYDQNHKYKYKEEEVFWDPRQKGSQGTFDEEATLKYKAAIAHKRSGYL